MPEYVIVIDKIPYAADRPATCPDCYFWDNRRHKCALGKSNCYYLLKRPSSRSTPCTDCPYGRDFPCIGWCTKKLLGEL